MQGWKFTVFVIIVALILIFLWQLGEFSAQQGLLPPGSTLGGLPVGGLTPDEAMSRLKEALASPVTLHYLDKEIRLRPKEVGFRLRAASMREEIAHQQHIANFWDAFANHLLRRPQPPVVVPLNASYDQARLREVLDSIAARYDAPMHPPAPNVATLTLIPGRPAQRLNVAASLPRVEAALLSPTDREADLVVDLGEAPPPVTLQDLGTLLDALLEPFPGLGAYFVKDLRTGEELTRHADVAFSGMSIVKIAIMTVSFIYLDRPPTPDQTKILTETMTLSGNFTANLLLRYVIGDGDAYEGVQRLNVALHRLGLVNTFMAAPYDEDILPQRIHTPANSRTDISADPDPFMQTTPQDMGLLLEMIYLGAQGKGTLIAAYPEKITPAECQLMLELMKQNHIGSLIEAGVPEGTPVAHKHGWIGDTHGDAGIVFSPGGDYVLCLYLYQPGWLEWDTSAPLIARLSQAVYNFFNAKSR